jgi:hypothetical protein
VGVSFLFFKRNYLFLSIFKKIKIMPTRQTQPGGNAYNEGFSLPSPPKVKTDANLILVLESKIDLLIKLFFEKSTKDPNGRSGLYLSKKIVYNSILLIELVNDDFFTANATVDIRFSISSKYTDETYFTKRFRVACNSKGSFKRKPLIMTTLDLSKKGYYADMILSAVAVDFSNGNITYLQDVVI